MFHISSHPIPYAGIVPTSNSRNGTMPTRANTSAATVTLPRVLASRPRKLRCSSSSWKAMVKTLKLMSLHQLGRITWKMQKLR